MKKIIFTLISIILFYKTSFAQATFIPDDNFEQALIDLGYDTGSLDDYVPTANIDTITTLDVGNEDIDDLTGIQDFIALEELICDRNNLTTLSLSTNLELTTLECNDNQLSSLDTSQNIALTTLECHNNQLNTLNVSQNLALTNIVAYNNQLTSIDVSQNTLLETLQCHRNQLTNLDVSQNTALQYLVCSENQLTNLNVSTNTQLLELTCGYNQLTNLDISQNLLLDELKCPYNQLTSLDVAPHTSLTRLNFRNNNLSSIDVTQNALLETLECRFNEISALDVSLNVNLDNLYCEGNQLTTLDVSQNLLLEALYCYDNLLTSLDVSANPSLFGLRCQDNQLNDLNVKNGNNINFSIFEATNNSNLTCIDVDDATYSTANWTDIDPQTSFSEFCNGISCNEAQPITISTTANTIDFNLSNEPANGYACGGNGGIDYADTWFMLTMPGNGNLGINGQINGNWFALYDSCGGTELACFNNQNIIPSLTGGTTYLLRVFRADDDASNPNFTSFNIAYQNTLGFNGNDISSATTNLFPNPASNSVSITISNDKTIERIAVFDVSGKRLMTQSNQNTLNTSQLPDGMYFMNIHIENQMVTKKLIIKK